MKRSNESSACWVARIVVCNSSPSPDRNRATEADALLPYASTVCTADAKTSWNAPPELAALAGRIASGAATGAMGRIGAGMGALPHQVDRTLDHILDRGYG